MTRVMQYLGFMAAVMVVLGVTGTGKAQTSELVGMLTSQLGVSEQQAAGGAGSLLNFAKGQMGSADFDVVSSALPETNDLIGAAPDVGSDILGSGSLGSGSLGSGSLGSSSLGSGSSLLGGSSGGLGDLAGVAGSFSDLGMSPDMVNQFVPVILDYAQSAGGGQTMQLLQGAFTAL